MSDAPRDPDRVKDAWAAYFHPSADRDDLSVLPDPLTDLRPFRAAIIPGQREKVPAGRCRDLLDHFRSLEPEFRGLPRLDHLLVCCIVCLRRDPGDVQAKALFDRILSEAGPDLARDLDTRWLTSICDTVIDTTRIELDRALALVGTLFVSTIKMAETELRLYHPQRPFPPKIRLRHGGEIYDGVQSLWTEGKGDVSNILARIERGLELASPLTPIVTSIIARAIEGNTFIKRIIATTGPNRLPMAGAEQLQDLRRIMAGL